jgi:hypothetical protein
MTPTFIRIAEIVGTFGGRTRFALMRKEEDRPSSPPSARFEEGRAGVAWIYAPG